MEKIAILTDSGSDLTLEELKENNVYLAPLNIIYSDGEFEDKIDITPNEVYASLEREIPKTSLPSTAKIEEILNKLEEEGYTHLIAITISSGLSGTANAIRLALEDHPKLKSFVYDTKILSMGEGVLVLNTAQMVKDGKSFDEIVEELPKLRAKTHGYFTINTLEYLKKGGRIGKVAGTIGEILNLKPIITVDEDGIYYTYAKVRGRKQSINRLAKITKGHLETGKFNVWILNGGSSKEEADALFNAVKDFDNIASISTAEIGPALGVHAGPGLLGVVVQEV
ncbi:fatty acid-binding protein DegV [Clostridium baratii]|uniref:DegV family protein n=1 Tax=Clostridium baratii TaxID=1561 RepID=UPI0009A397E3|nr:DegV family protein [Clostridium baratii]OPF52968.1 fatty acid-binding protein DegV [Clostridium baratii]OPF53812.1 fatty acid-binding protein DegV [Clostridium baratii]OPF54338.1 fatty acid-binding protein DegV [Clostridium baratii]OPF60810.1 fatty acid-binding protein DegV [Clostridium baratii]